VSPTPTLNTMRVRGIDEWRVASRILRLPTASDPNGCWLWTGSSTCGAAWTTWRDTTMTDENHELPDILGEDLGYLLGWVALGETLGDDDGEEAARAMGAAIVDAEEMQAIKAVLRHLAARQAMEVNAPTIDVLRLLGLPQVAVEWVMS